MQQQRMTTAHAGAALRRVRRVLVAVAALSLASTTGVLANILPKPTPAQRAAMRARGLARQIPQRPGWGVGNLPDSPLVGTVRGVCLLLRFPDADNDVAHNIAFFNNMFRGPANTESMSNWFKEMSFGQADIQVDTFGWFLLPGTTPGSVATKAGFSSGASELPPFRTMVETAIQTADPTVDFSQYDSDNNGIVDYLVIVHATRDTFTSPSAQAFLDFNGPFATSYSFARQVTGTTAVPESFATNDGVGIDSYIIIDESVMSRAGVLAHETGHTFGLPDMYDTFIGTGVNVGPIGVWSTMGRGILVEDTAIPAGAAGLQPTAVGWPGSPAHLDPWSKIQFGWITPQVIGPGTTVVQVNPIEAAGATVYKVFDNGDPLSSEYFLLERRDNVGFDTRLPGAGMVVWHIDESVIAANYLSNSVVEDFTHPGIAVVQADGLMDLENAIFQNGTNGLPSGFTQGNLGDAGDPYPGGTGNDRLVPSTDATPSNPSSDNYAGVSTGINITDIQDTGTSTTATITVDATFKPTVTLVSPAQGFLTQNITPTIVAQFADSHPNAPAFDLNTIQVTLDGQTIVSSSLGNVFSSFNASTNTLTFKPQPLTVGQHVVAVSGANANGDVAKGVDRNGQTATFAESVFNIAAKQIGSGLRMISVPYFLTRSNPTVVLGDSAPAVARYDVGSNAYQYFLTNPTSPFVSGFQPSRAYWARLDSSINLRLEGDDVPLLTFTATYEQPTVNGELPAGWLQIADPFNFAVDFNSLQVEYQGATMTLGEAVDQDLILPVLYRYSGSGYVFEIAPNGQLLPFEGYWVRVLKPIKILFPALQSGRAVRATESPFDGGWRVALRASVVGGQGDDSTSYFGASPRAVDGIGRLDAPTPPPAPRAQGGLDLSFVLDGASERLAQDLRHGPLAGRTVWNAVVSGTPAGETVAVTWGDLSAMPRNLRPILVDVDGQQRVYMRTSNQYSWRARAGERRRLQIVIDPDADAALSVRMTGAAAGSRAQGVVFRFALNRGASVSATIRTLSGRVVAQLPAVIAAPGANQVRWSGRGAGGRMAPPGAYLCEIRARTEDGQSSSGLQQFLLRP